VEVGRSIFSFEAKTNSAFARLTKVSVALTRNEYRLTYYQYPDKDYTGFELYNLVEDPEEMKDMYSAGSSLSASLKEELLDKLADANRAY
jgi:hypothetical protein